MTSFKRWFGAGAIVLVALALVACPNLVPTAKGSIPAMTFEHAEIGTSKTVSTLGRFFQDADGAKYAAASSKETVATASVDGTTLTVTAKGVGETTVTVTATASNGRDSSDQMFKVTVKAASKPTVPDPDNNQPRLVADELPDIDDLKVGHPRTVELAPLFTDDEDDVVTYHAESKRTTVARASVTGTTLTLTAVMVGTARIDVLARDGQHDVPVRESFTVTVVNQPPMVTDGVIEELLLRLPGGETSFDLTGYFDDPEDDPLTYTESVVPDTIADASIAGSMITITAKVAGTATITVTADDETDQTSRDLTLKVTDVPNKMPEVVGDGIPDQPLEMDFMAMKTLPDLSMYFDDPDSGPMALKYGAVSDMEMYATAMVDGSMLKIEAVAAGEATITVTASDGEDMVSDMFTVTVTNPAVPTWQKEIPDVTLEPDEMTRTFTLEDYFDRATMYHAESDNEDVVTAVVDDDQTMLTLTRVGKGRANVEITPSNSGGNGPTQTITVMVEAARQEPTTKANMMFEPVKITMIGATGNFVDLAAATADEITTVEAATKRYELLKYVTDPDGEDTELMFSMATDDNAVVAVYVTPTKGGPTPALPAGSSAMHHLADPSTDDLKKMMVGGPDITIRGRKAGTAMITVTATDTDGLMTPWRIMVTVVAENSAPEIDADNSEFPGDSIDPTANALGASFAQLDDERRFKSSDMAKKLKIDLSMIFSDDDIDGASAGERRGDSWTFKVMSNDTSVVTAMLVSTNNPTKPDEYNVVVTPVGPGDASVYFVVTDSFGKSFGGETPDDTDDEGTLIPNTFFPVRVNHPPMPYSGEGDDRNSLGDEDAYEGLVAGFAVTASAPLVDDPSSPAAEGYFSDEDEGDTLLCRLMSTTGDSATIDITARNAFTLTGAADKTGPSTFTIRCFDQVGGNDFEYAEDTLTVTVPYLQSIQ